MIDRTKNVQNLAGGGRTAGPRPQTNTERLVAILHRALLLTGATGAAFAQIRDRDLLTLASIGGTAPEVGSCTDIGSSFSGLCAQTGANLYCEDTNADTRVNAHVCRALNAASILLTPVREGASVKGVLAVFSVAPRAFSKLHVAALEKLAAAIFEVSGSLPSKLPARPLPTATAAPTSPATKPSGAPERSRPAEAPPAHASFPGPARILRFRKSERMIHWAIAVPFLVCLVSALVLVVIYNPHPQRSFRWIFAWLHRISGACLITLPVLVIVRHRSDCRMYFANLREACTWVVDDLKWLALMGAAQFNSRIQLPEQGKFNAAEKLNFLMVTCTCPLFALTGVLIWGSHVAFLSWVLHVAMAMLAAPLVLGHIFMATINPETRVGLSGMFSGYVDRHWARHHYRRWYRQNFETHQQPVQKPREAKQKYRWPPSLIECPSEAK